MLNVQALSRLVEEPYSKKIDWAKWYVFWADERMVPISHADSNYNTAKVGSSYCHLNMRPFDESSLKRTLCRSIR